MTLKTFSRRLEYVLSCSEEYLMKSVVVTSSMDRLTVTAASK